MFPLYGLVEVAGVDTDPELPVWFDDGYHGVDPLSGFVHTLNHFQFFHTL